MAFIPKKRKAANAKVDATKVYSLKDASTLVKEISTCKFDASVDIHIRLGVDPKKADQAIRGTVTLPHGTGKTKRVLVLCASIQVAEEGSPVELFSLVPVIRSHCVCDLGGIYGSVNT
jgi:large subunit ribosomal protein L1